VILSAQEKQYERRQKKTKRERSGAPVVETIIMLVKANFTTWTVIMDVKQAVDNVLERRNYNVEIRNRVAHPRGKEDFFLQNEARS